MSAVVVIDASVVNSSSAASECARKYLGDMNLERWLTSASRDKLQRRNRRAVSMRWRGLTVDAVMAWDDDGDEGDKDDDAAKTCLGHSFTGSPSINSATILISCSRPLPPPPLPLSSAIRRIQPSASCSTLNYTQYNNKMLVFMTT